MYGMCGVSGMCGKGGVCVCGVCGVCGIRICMYGVVCMVSNVYGAGHPI